MTFPAARNANARRLFASMLMAAGLSVMAGAALASDAQNDPAQIHAAEDHPAKLTEVEVKIENFAFTPAEITIKAGTIVTWKNRDPTPHAIAGSDFSSDMIDADESFSHAFPEPGSYDYICALHPAHMTGKVIVTP